MKLAQREELKERQRLKKEGITDDNEETNPNEGEEAEVEGDDGDLFGSDTEMPMALS
jgi:transcription initiation factor TFIID subunit 7